MSNNTGTQTVYIVNTLTSIPLFVSCVFVFQHAPHTHIYTHPSGPGVPNAIAPSPPTVTVIVPAPPPAPTIAQRRASVGAAVAVPTRAASPPAREADTDPHSDTIGISPSVVTIDSTMVAAP